MQIHRNWPIEFDGGNFVSFVLRASIKAQIRAHSSMVTIFISNDYSMGDRFFLSPFRIAKLNSVSWRPMHCSDFGCKNSVREKHPTFCLNHGSEELLFETV